MFFGFLLGGIAHFAFTEFELKIVPPYVPCPHAAVIVSGVLELLGAAGLLWNSSRRASGIGLFVLTLALTPANVYMLQRAELFNLPVRLLVARLPLQAGLLWLIWWSITPAAKQGSSVQLRTGGFERCK